jgi:hypothetical protein
MDEQSIFHPVLNENGGREPVENPGSNRSIEIDKGDRNLKWILK